MPQLTTEEAKRLARLLIQDERNTGPQWKGIIDALGYDPRQGYGKSTGLNFSQAWQQGKTDPRLGQKQSPQPGGGGGGGGGAAAPKKPPMPARQRDSIFTAGLAGLDLQYGQTLQDIGTARNRTAFDLGYGADGAVDPRNPYSQAMLLQKMWQEDRKYASASMAARGQLYSGARQSAIKEQDFNYQRNSSNLQENARRRYEDLTTAEQRAIAERNQGIVQLDSEQAGRWTQQEQEWWRLYG